MRGLLLPMLAALLVAGCAQPSDAPTAVTPVTKPWPTPPPSTTEATPPPTAAPPGPPSSTFSIVVNGGFEEGEGTQATRWRIDNASAGASPVGRYCTFSRSGECALALGHPPEGAFAMLTVRLPPQPASVEAVFWARDRAEHDRSADWFRAELLVFDADFTTLAHTSLTFEGTRTRAEWTEERLGPLAVPAGAAHARIHFKVHPDRFGDASQASLVTYVDDVDLFAWSH